jgi:hypothetical protein
MRGHAERTRHQSGRAEPTRGHVDPMSSHSAAGSECLQRFGERRDCSRRRKSKTHDIDCPGEYLEVVIAR